MQLLHDTNTVLKIELGDNNTYGDFVWVINEANVFNFKRYAYVGNHIFLFANEPKQYNTELHIQESRLNMIEWSPPGFWEILEKRMYYRLVYARDIVERNSLLVSGFIVLIILPVIIKAIINRRKKRKMAMLP